MITCYIGHLWDFVPKISLCLPITMATVNSKVLLILFKSVLKQIPQIY